MTGNTRNGRGQTRRATGSSQSGSQRRPQVPGASPGPAFWPFQPTTTGVVVCETCAAILRPQVPGASPGPAFWPFQPTTTGVVVCETCAAILPATDRAKAIHQRWHQQAGRS